MRNLIVKLFENENYIEEVETPDYKVIGMDIFGGAFQYIHLCGQKNIMLKQHLAELCH